MYWYIKNFHNHGEPIKGEKSKLRIVDFQETQEKIDGFKNNYRFADNEMTKFHFKGFNEQALDFIFNEDDS